MIKRIHILGASGSGTTTLADYKESKWASEIIAVKRTKHILIIPLEMFRFALNWEGKYSHRFILIMITIRLH